VSSEFEGGDSGLAGAGWRDDDHGHIVFARVQLAQRVEHRDGLPVGAEDDGIERNPARHKIPEGRRRIGREAQPRCAVLEKHRRGPELGGIGVEEEHAMLARWRG